MWTILWFYLIKLISVPPIRRDYSLRYCSRVERDFRLRTNLWFRNLLLSKAERRRIFSTSPQRMRERPENCVFGIAAHTIFPLLFEKTIQIAIDKDQKKKKHRYVWCVVCHTDVFYLPRRLRVSINAQNDKTKLK